jgi:hypothetical protein
MAPVMKQLMATIQGKKMQPDIQCINKLIADNPSWGRSRLSLELCRRRNWHNHNGQYKDMACRNLLLKPERADCIVLPERQRKYTGRSHRRSFEFVPHLTEEIDGDLKTFGPLQIASVAQYSDDSDLFNFSYLRVSLSWIRRCRRRKHQTPCPGSYRSPPGMSLIWFCCMEGSITGFLCRLGP